MMSLIQSQGASTGFTSPSSIYQRMRQMETASAAPLGHDVEDHVASGAYKAAWRAWYRTWLDFFGAHAAEGASTWTQLGDLTHSDEVSLRVESFRRELEDFYRTYPLELGVNGRPVPAPRGASPLVTTLSPVEKGWPWWIWIGALGVLGTVGVLGYRRYQRTERTQIWRRRTRS